MPKILSIPTSIGFCKNCFRMRRDGSAYCGECKKNEKIKVFIDDRNNFPLLKEAKKKFPVGDGTIFTYGNTIYGEGLDAGLIAHELTHVTQQTKMGADVWWKKYLEDVDFRMDQEAQAYHNQYLCYKRNNLVKGEVSLERMARHLSGGLYGVVIDFWKARRIIKNYKKI